MSISTNLAYQAKTLATKAAVVTDNLATHLAELPAQYQPLLQTEKLRTATTATTAALSEYEANYDYKQTLASTAQRHLAESVTAAKTTHQQALAEVAAERTALKQKWQAELAALNTREAELVAAHKASLQELTATGQATVEQHRSAAKDFGDKLDAAYRALRSLYTEYTNLVQAVDAALPAVELARAVLPRSAPRTARRTTATVPTTAATTATGSDAAPAA